MNIKKNLKILTKAKKLKTMYSINVSSSNLENFLDTIKISSHINDNIVFTDEQRSSFISAINYINEFSFNKRINRCFIIYGRRQEGISTVLSSIAKYCNTIGKNTYFIGNIYIFKIKKDIYTERIYNEDKLRGLDYNKSVLIIDDLDYFVGHSKQFPSISYISSCIPTIIGTTYWKE